MKLHKSMREKIINAPKNLPKIVKDPRGRGLMFVPSPFYVEKQIKKIPRGKLTTAELLREKNWFLRMVAEAAMEEMGIKKDVAPWWRIINKNGSLNPKFPGGGKLQATLLKKEGHKVTELKNKTVINSFEIKLIKV